MFSHGGADLSALQAREVCLVLPLDLLEVRKELFRSLRGPLIGAQLCHELELPHHAGGTLADMAADHLQIVFFLRHVLSRRIQGSDRLRLVPGEGQAQLHLTKSRD